ncbi:MAG TPA: response regulator transcription factor [Thermoanaerobaculia bacterium]|nr:response regulator transcription factor [Thermoanaerobaculia bacterium]
MPEPLVLVAEDDSAIRETLCDELAAAGYRTLAAPDGRDAISGFESAAPDLVLTDIAMPNGDGFRVITAIRRRGRTPIIVLSVLGGESDKVRALDLGADDYVTKPFSVAELLARVRAQLRRAEPPRTRLEFDDLTVDVERRYVRQGGREVHLTPTEFAILELLAGNAGKPVSSREIARRVWESGEATPDTVRVHVGSLRRKLEPDPSVPRYIVTEPWFGYRFIAEPK